MKKITDERLIVRNLKNQRTAFLVENGFILCVLAYQIFQGTPLDQVVAYDNMLFLALMVGCWTMIVLSVTVSTSMEDKAKVKLGKLLLLGLIVFVIAAGSFLWLLHGKHLLVALGSGLIIATIVTGINVLANHFRYSEQD